MNFWRVHKVAVTGSTNDDAKAAAESGEAEGHVVWALKQENGRGRHGRLWESPEGNLYCSALLRPQSAKQNIGCYSFVIALALHDTVKGFLPHADVTLKWPNDVLVTGKKISGILLESGGDWLVAGMGLNVKHHPETALYPTTSLDESGAGKVDIAMLLDHLLQRLHYWYGLMNKDGFAPIRTAWLERAQKGAMTVRLPNSVLEGFFDDLDLSGNLKLRLADGAERSIATGDVFLTLRN